MLPFVVLIIIMLLFTYSCGTYVKQPVASHVVAVTMEGDTILVAIDKIRPNMYMNVYPIYSSYNPYYNNQYYGYNNYRFRYPDNRGTSTSNSKDYRVPAPTTGGTTYDSNSTKTISRIDYDKAADRGAAGKPRK